MAKYDLPAMVDKALSISGAQQVFYVGHSQGGGLGIAQLSEDPVFASKIKMYVGLAPGVYMDNVKSPISLLMPFMEDIEVGEMSRDARKPVFVFPTRSDTNRTVQSQKMTRCLKFCV